MTLSRNIVKLIMESAASLTAYHGTNAKFKQFEQSKSRIPNDYYGGGVAYFTVNKSVAITYAQSMVRKYKGQVYIYEVNLKMKNVFDVDHKFTGKELTKFFSDKEAEDFARGAGLLKAGADKYTVLGKLKSGDLSLTGDEVFKGLSRGMVNTAKARQKLIDLDYDGLRYNGGKNMQMATEHDVYLAYDAGDIQIKKIYTSAPKVG